MTLFFPLGLQQCSPSSPLAFHQNSVSFQILAWFRFFFFNSEQLSIKEDAFSAHPEYKICNMWAVFTGGSIFKSAHLCWNQYFPILNLLSNNPWKMLCTLLMHCYIITTILQKWIWVISPATNNLGCHSW